MDKTQRRVVVTGLGIVSSIGSNRDEVVSALKQGQSGIEYNAEYAELGFRSHVYGSVKLNPDEVIERRLRRFMGDGAAFNFVAMEQAIADAGLHKEHVSNPRSGLVMGSGGPSTSNLVMAADILRSKGARKVGPFMVPRTMSSTNSACLATPFAIKGVRHQRPRHRSRRRANSDGQTGHRFRRRRRRDTLDPERAVRRHGGLVRRLQ